MIEKKYLNKIILGFSFIKSLTPKPRLEFNESEGYVLSFNEMPINERIVIIESIEQSTKLLNDTDFRMLGDEIMSVLCSNEKMAKCYLKDIIRLFSENARILNILFSEDSKYYDILLLFAKANFLNTDIVKNYLGLCWNYYNFFFMLLDEKCNDAGFDLMELQCELDMTVYTRFEYNFNNLNNEVVHPLPSNKDNPEEKDILKHIKGIYSEHFETNVLPKLQKIDIETQIDLMALTSILFNERDLWKSVGVPKTFTKQIMLTAQTIDSSIIVNNPRESKCEYRKKDLLSTYPILTNLTNKTQS